MVSLESPSQKKRSKWRIIGYCIGILLILWIIIYFFPVKSLEKQAFFVNDRPLVIAHGGGQGLAPTSTLEAFKNSYELGVDVIEFDVHMTKDGYLAAIHDPTVDRTTNGTGKVNEMTLEEVQALDAGVNFQDEIGEYTYKGKGVHIPTVQEAFAAIPDMRWNIEIKDSNNPHLYRPIAEKLWGLIQQYRLEDKVLIASFDQDIVDIVSDVSDGKALTAGGRQEITKLVLLHKIFLNGLYQPKVHAIEIPTEDSSINLIDAKIIKGAHKRGMDVHYWTINDAQTMRELLDLGADGILTDRPDILLDVLKEYE